MKPDSSEFDNIKMEKDPLPGEIILSQVKKTNDHDHTHLQFISESGG